jgi:hypothetical protein
MKKTPGIKNRGKFLTLMILFLVLGDVQIPYYLVNSNALHAVFGNVQFNELNCLDSQGSMRWITAKSSFSF